MTGHFGHRVIGHQRLFSSKLLGSVLCGEQRLRTIDRMAGKLLLEQIPIQGQILNPTAAKVDVGVSQPFGDHARRATCDLEHFGGHVDPDGVSRRSDLLSS